ncbi:uncharacterized protein LOC142555259 [Primulina tabacum]|uniref:uncharacterized protein LOC142555259 n=1 Tax=Primulina tabacum TaxID=48773 RepID=UPI003F59A5C3
MMNMEEKDPTKSMDWKVIEESVSSDPNPSSDPVIKKRLPRRMRQIPEFYFLPRRSIPYNLAFYGAWIAGGIGAGMVIETWINKKVKEDGGVIWEFDK